MQDIEPEDARALLASTQQLRTHWSGVITTHLGVAITVNVAIWAYFLKSYVDVSSTSAGGDFAYLYLGGGLSSFFIGLWRVYARHIDDHIANLYPDLILYEGILKAPLGRSTRGYLAKEVPRTARFLAREDINLQGKVEAVKALGSMRRIGHRGHFYIDLCMLFIVSLILAGSAYLMIRSGIIIESLFLLLNLMGFGLIIFAMLHFQKNPREEHINEVLKLSGAPEQMSSEVPMNQPPTHLSEAKERYLLEAQKAYILVNGAGAAALLAFLQAIWNTPTAAPLREWVLYGIVAFAVGVAFGASSYPLRHRAYVVGASTPDRWLYRVCYWFIPAGAIIAFLLGLGLPVFGAFLALGFGVAPLN